MPAGYATGRPGPLLRIEFEDDPGDLDIVSWLKATVVQRVDDAHLAQTVLDVRQRVLVFEVMPGDQEVHVVPADTPGVLSRRLDRKLTTPLGGRPVHPVLDVDIGELLRRRRRNLDLSQE